LLSQTEQRQTVNESDAVIVDLIRRARKGDREALGELLNGHRDLLRALAQQQLDPRIGARLDASDLVQQTCLSVHKRIAEFQGDEVPQFVAWLKEVHEHNVRNAVRDQLQAQKRAAGREEALGERDVGAARQTSPSQRAMQGEEARRLARALEQLPEEEREVLRLRYLEGWTLQQLCAHTGMTKDALVWLMKRGMKEMRKLLDEKH
jgi:RNA polymerase sigma-70 factor (ECF subfamily)